MSNPNSVYGAPGRPAILADSGLAVYDLPSLQALDITGLAQGTPCYVASIGRTYYLRTAVAPTIPGSVSVAGAVLATWTPQIASQAIDPVMVTPGVMAINGVSIPGIELWLDANDETSIVRAAAASWPQIVTWKDKSGLSTSGARDVTGTALPTLVEGAIGTRRAMRCNPGYFVNTTTNLGSGGQPSPGVDRGARTVIIVAKGASVNGGTFISYRASVTNNCFTFGHIFTGGNIQVKASGGADQHFLAAVPNINGISHAWQYKYDGRFANTGALGAVRVRLDGAEMAVQGGNLTVTETGTNGFVIGNFLINSTIFDGFIAEVICVNRETTTYEDHLFNQYISLKYGTAYQQPQLHVLMYGDSLFLGSGDATTLANGGMRKELNSLHGNLLFNVGSFYQPASVTTGLPPVAGSQDGQFNRCEGNAGFTSANNVAHGIGGQYCVTTLTSTPADVIMLFIGINDNVVDGLTAAQSVTNILQILDQIAGLLPAAKVVLMRPTYLATFHASAGTANPIVTSLGTLLEAALVTTPRANVIKHGTTGQNVIIPTVIPDAMYAANGTDGTHPGNNGWHFFITQGTTNGGFDAELRARGL